MSDSAIPIDEVPVHEMNREQATQALDKMKEAYAKEHPPDEWTLGEQHADGQLERMKKDPHRVSDPIEAGLAGDLPSGVMVPFGPDEGNAIAAHKLQSLISDLRNENMLTDGAIREALLPHLHSVTPEEMAAALKLEGELHGDATWRDRLLNKGDTVARNQLVLLEIIKGLPVKPKAA